jgi:hypothetical protein
MGMRWMSRLLLGAGEVEITSLDKRGREAGDADRAASTLERASSEKSRAWGPKRIESLDIEVITTGRI